MIFKKSFQEIALILIFFQVSQALTGEEAVRRFFQYFKADNPVGIPVLDLPEPFELYTPLETIPITMINATLKGHSQIKIEQAFIDLLSLSGDVAISAPRLEVSGNYTWPSVFFTSEGEMNATMSNVTGHANFTLFVDENYALQIKDIQIDQKSDEVFIDMTNLIWEHRLIVESKAIYFFFDQIVLEIFRQLRPFLIGEINKEISDFFSKLPPIRNYVLEGSETQEVQLNNLMKRLIQYLGMEPLKLKEKRLEHIGIDFKISDVVLHGLSAVGEVQKLFCGYQDKVMYIEASISYPKLLLFFNLEVDLGVFDFDVYEKNQLNDVIVQIKLMVDLSQKTPPHVRRFDLKVRSVSKLRTGKKHFATSMTDGIRKEVVNFLPGPLMSIIQNDLNKLDLEKEVLSIMKKRS